MQHSLNLFGATFKHPGHYVPVLQDHVGERRALGELRGLTPAVLDRCMPMIQILGGDSRELSRTAIREHVKRIAEVMGTDRPWYLDFVREKPGRLVHTPSGRLTVAEIAYQAATRRQLAYVPVAWTWDRAHLDRAANAAMGHHRGMALRHRMAGGAAAAGTNPTAAVVDALQASQLNFESVDLLLDLGFIDPDVTLSAPRFERTLRRYLALGRWRRVCLIGSSMPKTLKSVKEDTEAYLPRQEWALWSSLSAELRRAVSFGDYGVQHPSPPQNAPKAMGMRANIRYTVENSHLVARARGAVKQEGPQQYRELCRRLRKYSDFDGSGASCGDDTIVRCADGQIPPQHQDMWRQAGTSRHLTVVSKQVLALL